MFFLIAELQKIVTLRAQLCFTSRGDAALLTLVSAVPFDLPHYDEWTELPEGPFQSPRLQHNARMAADDLIALARSICTPGSRWSISRQALRPFRAELQDGRIVVNLLPTRHATSSERRFRILLYVEGKLRALRTFSQ